MKVLHLINLQGFGGVEKRFIKYLNKSKHNNIVMCVSNNIDERIEEQFSKKDILFVNRVFNSFKIKWPSFYRKKVLIKKIEKQNTDAIIVWDFIPKLITKPQCGKLFYYDCGCGWRYPKNERTMSFFNKVDGFISNSNASKRVMQLRYHIDKDIKVILNKLDLPIKRKPKSLDNKKNIILGTASRLVGLKGIGISLLVLKQLLNKGINTKLIIAGSGEDESKLKELANKLDLNDYVEFLGYQSELSDFYHNINIYLSTPITEAFGLSCIEALANGVPVIFPKIDGQMEAIKDNYCGIGLKPQLTLEQYFVLTGLSINFDNPIYDPETDNLVDPKLLLPNDCVDAIEKIVENYNEFSLNALSWSKMTMNFDLFVEQFDDVVNSEC
ncbi:glycosyltransferase [Proteus vulgaris]|uniref:glycosyltransferase n=1 Tax=Proteus vulgaris TaxID=585 RepID=UPI0034D4CC33